MTSKPIFSRRHYEFIAKLLREGNNKALTTEDLAKALQSENPNFKPERFYKAAYASKP